MYSKLNDLMIRAYVLLQTLERGDADSSGSTMRTAGVVALILFIFMVIGGAVVIAANNAAPGIQNPFTP